MTCCVNNINFLMQKVTLHFIFDASYDMMVNCNLIRQINKRHLVRSKIFSSMQEITHYFLRQNRFRLMLI